MTNHIATIPAITQADKDALTSEYQRDYPSYAALANKEEGEFTLCSLRAIAKTRIALEAELTALRALATQPTPTDDADVTRALVMLFRSLLQTVNARLGWPSAIRIELIRAGLANYGPEDKPGGVELLTTDLGKRALALGEKRA